MSYPAFEQWRARPLDRVTLSIVIPAYNESERILPTLAAFAVAVSAAGEPWELIVSDDGSRDGTADLVESLGWANLRVIRHANTGKGGAVRRGVRASRGELVLFADADNSTPIEELPRLIAAVRAGAHIAIGSRAAEGAEETGKSPVRRAVSGALRRVTRAVTGVTAEDTQCGFKLLRGEVAHDLFRRGTLDGFSFDLELLYLAARDGLRVTEVPVRWVDAPDSKVDPLRDSVKFLKDMLALRRLHARPARAPGDPMHLAVVTAFPPGRRSLNEYGLHLSRVLSEKEEVRRVTILADRVAPELAAQDAPNVRRIWEFNDPLSAARILLALRRARPDAVIFNLQMASFGDRRVPAALGLLTPLLARLTGTPSVTLLHNLFETVDLDRAGFGGNPVKTAVTRTFGRVFTRALLGSNLVATTMPRYVKLLRDRYGARNVFLAPHGTFQVPQPPRPFPDVPTVMTFGKFGTYKRVEVLIEAHRRLLLRDPRTRLVIAGSDTPNAPGYLDGVRRACADVPNVTFTGYVAEEDVPGVFSDCTVVAFPYSATTGSSGVLHQAGEFGRAAVMPRIGDLADLIEEEGYRAEFFTPEDPDSLADALWRVLGDPRQAAALGEANWRVAAGLPLADVADWYLLHLEELTGRAPTPTPAQEAQA
ncbi:glycosyltransferase [Deinococcus depolymerans]|uniref:dolichyl-phosphate beta-glucosyltransferase n=1 Tax=Deinococcus depolymerans TaxID=392408 RepID=A0ABP3LJL9_9DEIO